MEKRTDLISEITVDKKGIRSFSKDFGLATVTVTDIDTEELANLICRPKGTYCTVKFDNILRYDAKADIEKAVAFCVSLLLPEKSENILVAGIGNRDITPDALGVFSAELIIPTRHIKTEINTEKSVSTVIPNIEGKTGIKSGEIIFAAVNTVKPDVLLAIDALACRDTKELFASIQISNSGILLGSGVSKKSYELSKKTLGKTVIAVGVPTVTDHKGGMVTPKEADILIKRSAEIIAGGINLCFCGVDRL